MKNAFRHIVGAMMTMLALAIVVGAAREAVAQASKQPLFKGTRESRGQPVKIQAANLEVRDKEKIATFSGEVRVIQGDTDVRCGVLVVHYEGQIGSAGSTPPQGGGGKSQIRRMEARGGVVVIQKDQKATGDRGEFDMRANTITLIGKVVVTRGTDVMRGEKLFVELDTGVYRMESGSSRVEGLFTPNSADKKKGATPDGGKRVRREGRRPPAQR